MPKVMEVSNETGSAAESAPRSALGAASATSIPYVISGLRVSSEVELPSAIQADAAHTDADVVIRRCAVAETLAGAESSGDHWAIAPGRFLLSVPGVMRALVVDGRSIEVEVDPEADPGDCVLFLLGTVFAILLHQRGRVVLHASAVAVHGRAMLFCGVSGAGKSTIAAMLVRRGYPLLNDDVCNLSPVGEAGEYAVYPDGRMLKLWGQSMEHLQRPVTAEQMVRRDTDKYYMAPERVDLTPRPVGGVYLLEEGDGEAGLERLNVAEATAELAENAYRPRLVYSMGMMPAYFAASVAIQRRAGVYRLRRPKDFARADEALDLLEEMWVKGVEERV